MVTILHIIDSLAPGGGAEHQLATMLSLSDQSRFCHVVCVLSGPSAFTEALEKAGIRVHALGLTLGRDLVRGVRQLWSLAADVRPDVVHTSLFWATILGRFVGRLARKPVLTTLVNTSYEPAWRLDNPRLTPAKVAFVRWLDGFTARRWGTWFVAITEAVKKSTVQQLGVDPRRISVIPRGLTPELLTMPQPEAVAAIRRSMAWDDAYPVALSVGRLVPQKGHRYAIEAMADVVKTFPTARLAIAGEGYLRRELEDNVRRLCLESHVQFLGQRPDVQLLLAASDLFLFPSLFEGFGCALAEAMAMEKPCIASRLPALEEVTDGGDCAYLVPNRSPVDLGAAIIHLAKNRDTAARLGARAGRWVREHYDIHASTGALEDVCVWLTQGLARRPATAQWDIPTGHRR